MALLRRRTALLLLLGMMLPAAFAISSKSSSIGVQHPAVQQDDVNGLMQDSEQQRHADILPGYVQGAYATSSYEEVDAASSGAGDSEPGDAARSAAFAAAAAAAPRLHASPLPRLVPAGARRDIVVWQMRLDDAECAGSGGGGGGSSASPSSSAAAAAPCYNLYALNATSGALLWYAYSTDVTGIRGAAVGRRAVYFTTWSGPGLYSVALASGRVRWHFPPSNWFAYWRKAIDLPPSASFARAGEGGAGAAFAAAAGPPARAYGLRVKGGGEQEWEWRADDAGALLTATAGPDLDASAGASQPSGAQQQHQQQQQQQQQTAMAASSAGTLYLALTSRAANASWLQAVALADGAAPWRSPPAPGAAFDALAVDGPRLLAADSASGLLAAYDKASGSLLWRREGRFCATPGPLARVFDAPRRRPALSGTGSGDGSMGRSGGGGGGGGSSGGGVLLVAEDCASMARLAAVDSATGRELWAGLDAPRDMRPSALRPGCTWAAASGGSLFVGCNCGDADGGDDQRQPSSTAAPVASGGGAVCMYALSLATGRRIWARRLEIDGAGEFDADAQAWGQAPLPLRGSGGAGASGAAGAVVAFVTNASAIALGAADGRVAWRAPLLPGERVAPWQQATQCGGSGGSDVCADSGGGDSGAPAPAPPPQPPPLLLHSLRGAGNRTTVYAIDPVEGRALWARSFNGSMQPPPSRAAGAAALLPLAGGRVVAEACRRARCCLRGLDAATGRRAWSVCLDARRGTDPTNPRAQFAIWVVTLVAVASIAALIAGAALLYIHRWAEERAMLQAGGGGGDESGLDAGGAAGGAGGAAGGAAGLYQALPGAPLAGVRRVGAPGAGGFGGGGGRAAAPYARPLAVGSTAATAARDSSDDEEGDVDGGEHADHPGAPPRRMSLFARAGGVATTVLGGPPSPGSTTAEAFAAAGGGGAAGAAGGDGGSGGGYVFGLGQLLGGGSGSGNGSGAGRGLPRAGSLRGRGGRGGGAP